MTAPACEVRGLTKRFGDRAALQAVSFAIASGQRFALLGPNGGGKSTLFKIVSTLLAPSEGDAFVCGRSSVTEPEAVRSQLGIVFQSPSLDAKLTIHENLRYHGALYGLFGAPLASRIDELLTRFGLADRKGELVSALSGGLARRVDLARGLLHRPPLLLLDEPSTGLDPRARRELSEHLTRLCADEGTTVLLTTHILEEAEHADRVGILDLGTLVAEGTPDELKSCVGGDVVTLKAADAEAAAKKVTEAIGVETQVVDGRVRFEAEGAPALVPKVVEALGGDVLEVTMSRPTLEDVFIRKTGRTFIEAELQEASA